MRAVLAFLLVPLGGLTAQTGGSAFPAELDRYVGTVLSEWEIPGIAIAVVRNDSTLVAKGYGVRQLGEPERVDGSTRFDVASLTKSFTATAAAILVDRGVLRWDDPVRRYLPDLLLPNDSLTARATIRDFLSHRTGIEPVNMMWVPTAVDRDEVLRRMRYVGTVAPFRDRMVYSNIGYLVAGAAAATAAGTTFETLLSDLVIRPLRLSSTTWTYEQAAGVSNAAASHATIEGRQQVIPRSLQRQPIASVAPATAVQSSAADLARWMRLHLNNGVLDGRRYVCDSSMRAMHSVQVRISTTPAMRAARLVQDTVIGYGLGWQIMDYRGHRVLWHTGNGTGQVAYMALFPDDRLGIAVMVNTWSAPLVHSALVNHIADTYLGYEPRDWAGEAFARLPSRDSARAANERTMIAMRSPVPPRVPLRAFAGRYDHPVFGPVWIRLQRSLESLTLQMGDGQIADLEYHGADAFYVVWREPLFREYYGTHVVFTMNGDSVAAFTTTLSGERFTARKQGTSAPARTDLTGADAILGRWNLRILNPRDVFSSWLEVERSGFQALVGRFVGLIGGARPIGKVEWSATDRVARFTIPTEWELPSGDLRGEFRPAGDSIVGTLVRPDGIMMAFVGKRAPLFQRSAPTAWTAPVPLFNGRDLSGWTPALTARSLPNFWTVRDGILVNDGDEGTNLMTVQRFQDFRLHAEFRLTGRNTSGIFPRGRYWVILKASRDSVPGRGTTGAVHRFLVPNEDATLGSDVWQAIDITLVGRRITVVVNGKTVIADQIVPGITGSAIDSDEAGPGPIMLQGEEQHVEFRNITISVPTERSSDGEVGKL